MSGRPWNNLAGGGASRGPLWTHFSKATRRRNSAAECRVSSLDSRPPGCRPACQRPLRQYQVSATAWGWLKGPSTVLTLSPTPMPSSGGLCFCSSRCINRGKVIQRVGQGLLAALCTTCTVRPAAPSSCPASSSSASLCPAFNACEAHRHPHRCTLGSSGQSSTRESERSTAQRAAA